MTSGLNLGPTTARLQREWIADTGRNSNVSKVALICDLHQEQWPSMDLVGDMLFAGLTSRHGDRLQIQQIRPIFHRRFLAVPGFSNVRAAKNVDRLIHRWVDYPGWLKRNAKGFDLYHVVDHSYAQLVHKLPSRRTVVTCHDLDAFRCLIDPDMEPRPRWFQAMMRRVLDGLQNAARIICGSEAVGNEIVERALVARERVTVIHNGIDESCRPYPQKNHDARAAVLLGCNEEMPLLLHVGSTIQRKRIDVLLEVFASVLRRFPETILVRVGGPLTEPQCKLAHQLGVDRKIRTLPFLDRDVLAAVYRRATLLLQTSSGEGFGLPVAEAMGCGCPVVASDLPVLREVGGTAAQYCSVANIEEWTETVVSMLTESKTQSWQHRQAAAIENASRFSWSNAADDVARLYSEVLGKI